MGCNVKEKSIRHARKHRPSKPSSFPNPTTTTTTTTTTADLSNPNPNSFDNSDSGWGYCTEDQLEELLLKNLDFVYKEALSRLVSLGYDESSALRSLLNSGHCYGGMDLLSNILHNSISFLNSPDDTTHNNHHSHSPNFNCNSTTSFSDLRHLQEYSLSGLICLIQQVRPELSRGDAMWCLLMSDLHVGRATAIDLPSSKFHDPKRKLIPPFPSRSIVSRSRSRASSAEKESDVVASVLKSLETMSIQEEEEDDDDDDHDVDDDDHDDEDAKKKERIMSLIKQIRDLEQQVKEREEWAQQKARQAAKRLSNDLTELKVLRMEREENQRVKRGKQALEDTTMKRLSEMESALKKASGQVDRANAVVNRLQIENAEIKAELEASKLSASESVTSCLEVAKREKKGLKRLLAWEKQREKLQEEVGEERKKIGEWLRQLNEVKEALKVGEVKWREEIKSKEQGIAMVEEERRAKETVDSSFKRKNEALRRKIEIDLQRHKDDIHRLEEELSRLKASGDLDMSKLATKVMNSKGAQGFKEPQNLLRKRQSQSRECMMCTKDEVNVVFLPCAHQVLCVCCSEEQERKAKICPCCNAHIDQRIRVFGAAF